MIRLFLLIGDDTHATILINPRVLSASRLRLLINFPILLSPPPPPSGAY